MLVNSVNPDRIEGQKTAAFEIAEELGAVPDALLLPYGGGGNTRAFFRGFEELGAMPHLLPTQAAARERPSRPRSGSPSLRTRPRSTRR